MSDILSVRNLHVAFGSRVVIDGLSFTVHHGDSLAIIGPNGSGKTALLRALLNLIPYEGQISWSPGVRLGYVPQKVAADRELPLTVRDILRAKCKFLHLTEADVNFVSSQTALSDDMLDSRLGILSGGQFQKVLIAFALLGNPNVLLFDEPTASLDDLSEEHVYESLHLLQKEQGFTTLLVSHDLSIVYRYANVVLCLSRTNPCLGPPREVLTPQMLEELYSAPPMYYQHIHDHQKG